MIALDGKGWRRDGGARDRFARKGVAGSDDDVVAARGAEEPRWQRQARRHGLLESDNLSHELVMTQRDCSELIGVVRAG